MDWLLIGAALSSAAMTTTACLLATLLAELLAEALSKSIHFPDVACRFLTTGFTGSNAAFTLSLVNPVSRYDKASQLY